MAAHHEVFSRFQLFSGPAEAGHEIDFLGCRIRHEMWPSSIRTGIPQTTYPNFEPEYFEWIDLLESVVEANGKYTMIELGAGFGRWAVRAERALKQYSGLPCHLIAVEAEPTHFQWLGVHFADNGIDPGQHTLINAAITDQHGPVLFYVGMPNEAERAPSEWYGQAIIKPYEVVAEADTGDYKGFKVLSHKSGWQSISVPTTTLSEILRTVDLVDLIDMDLQAEEYKVLASAIEEATAKVKRLHISTHSHEIEEDLRRLLPKFGWECTADFACTSTNPTPWGTFAFVDGVQSWKNPRL